jgi:hypothetical protein
MPTYLIGKKENRRKGKALDTKGKDLVAARGLEPRTYGL